MKTLKQHINEALKIGNNLSEWSSYSCQPKTTEELKKIIEDRIKKQGNNCDLNDIDVSLITDMSDLFGYMYFNGDISKWNVSSCITMIAMFGYSKFNGDISKWDVSSVTGMSSMFVCSNFNQDISKWKISKLANVAYMFDRCPIKKEYKPKL